MKKIIFILLLLLFYNVGFTQVKNIIANVSGNFVIVVIVGEDASVTITPDGKIDDIGTNGAICYDMLGRVEKIGKVDFRYDMLSRVEKIGKVDFSYDMLSRVEKIGKVDFGYDMLGRIEGIGKVDFGYDMLGRLSSSIRSFVDSGISFRVMQ